MSNIIHRSMGIVSYEIKRERQAAEKRMSEEQGIIEDEKLPPEFNLIVPSHKSRVIRKVFIDIASLIKQIPTKRIFTCFDGESFRKEVDIRYKANRPEKPEEFKNMVFDIYDICVAKQLNAFLVHNLEADDCASLLTMKLADEWNVIVSADADVTQNVTEKTFVLVPLATKRQLYMPTLEGYDLKRLQWYPELQLKSIHPVDVLTEKFLKGCKGDNVAPLAPKGFRTKKVEEAAEFAIQNLSTQPCAVNVDEDPDYIEAMLYAAQQVGLSIPTEQALKQLQLVCLGMQHIPLESVIAFDNITIYTQQPLNLTTDQMLRNTPYWSSF